MTTILAFLSEKIVAVVITTVVVVAAVPTLIVAVNGNTITITTAASSRRHHDEDERARIIVEVKDAANAVVVKINDEEASCDSQIAELASKTKLSATATAAALSKGKGDFHATVTPFLNQIKADEDELEHLTVITTQTEQTFLIRINEVQVLALGENGQTGTLVTVCQAIIIQITQVIVVTTAGDGDTDGD